ncbi:MAG: MFS transporter [Prochlorococcus sp.]
MDKDMIDIESENPAEKCISDKNSTSRIITAGIIGNVMEWYDFGLYGYFATIIGREFFPSADPSNSLIAAFGAFAAGFLVRPFGGMVFGRIGDLLGRRRALTISVILMGLSTLLMALLPTYHQVGIMAPIAIVLLRLLQGLSVGGEYTSSIIFLCERAPNQQRGFYGVWGLWGSVLGMLIGSGFGDALSQILTADQLTNWGWRIPFAAGALVALTGFVIRRGLDADVINQDVRRPVQEAFGRHRSAMLRVMLLNIASSVVFYLAFVYAVSYVEVNDGLSDAKALSLNTGVMALLLLLYPISAWISDRIGRKPMFIVGAGWLLIGSWPIFRLLHSTDPSSIFRGELGLMVAVALLAGAKNAANVELMPAPVRCTGLALAFNAAEGWFGGTTPLVAAWLIAMTGNPMMPALPAMAAALVTLVTVVGFTRETAFLPLET